MNELHNKHRTRIGVQLRIVRSTDSDPLQVIPIVHSTRVHDDREAPSQSAIRLLISLITIAVVVFAIYQL